MELKLFEVEKRKIEPNSRCRNCIHILSNYWNSSLKYCNKQNGRKIKALDPACTMFERKPAEQEKL